MVHISLPVNIGAGDYDASIGRRGVQLEYTETPIVLYTVLVNKHTLFGQMFQYRLAQDLEVVVTDMSGCTSLFNEIFESNMFVSDMSVELHLKDHLSAGLAIELSKSLGIGALAANVAITTTHYLKGIAESLLQSFTTSPALPRYLVEQFMFQSPERFPPGNDDVFQPIPFREGDSLSFFLTLRFDSALIENTGHALTTFLSENELPEVRHVLRFSFAS